jgi:hypothetical protein
LLLEYEPAVEAAAVNVLFRNLQNELALWRRSPDEPGPSACSAIADDFHRPAVDSARRLRSGTFAVAKIPPPAIQIKNVAGADRAAVRLDPIQRAHLAFTVGLDPKGEAPGLSVSGKGGSGRIQLPAPKRLPKTASLPEHDCEKEPSQWLRNGHGSASSAMTLDCKGKRVDKA